MATAPTLREVLEEDWPVILALANRSVAAVPGVGPALLERAGEALAALGAREVFFVEYAGDAAFTGFLERHGVRRNRTFRLDSGAEAVVLGKRLDAGRA